MFTALAHFLLSGVQFPTAGYGPVHKHLTAGITYPKKVKPSRGSNSANLSSGHSGRRVRTSVSQACGSRLRFPEGSLSVPRGSRPSVNQRTTGLSSHNDRTDSTLADIVVCALKCTIFPSVKVRPANSRSDWKDKKRSRGNKRAESLLKRLLQEVNGLCGP